MADQTKCPHGNSGQFGCSHCTLSALQLNAKACAWCRRRESYGFGVDGLCGPCSRAAAQGRGPKFGRDIRLGRVEDIFPAVYFRSAGEVMQRIQLINAQERFANTLLHEQAPLQCTRCSMLFRVRLYPWPFGLCPACGPASEPPNVRHKL